MRIEMTNEDIRDMCKLIPMNYPICLADLVEIYYGIQFEQAMVVFRSMAEESP
jgi:hypothetical protein